MKLGLGLAVILLAAGIFGCGNGDSTSSTGTAGKRIYPWLEGPSRQFLIAGGDNAVQTFGEEGTLKQRAEATAVIAAWLRARARKAWKADCSYFSRLFAKGLAKDAHSVTKGRVRSCPEALAFFKEEASGDYVDTLTGSIDSLRVGDGYGQEGKPAYLGYAQYHGNDGRDWIVPLEREAGEWKIGHSRPFGRNE